MSQRWDIFCKVIDNYGDIGICWRLARQLAIEHKLTVRLWVDDLIVFSKISPEICADVEQQWLAGVEICHWLPLFKETVSADVVIEAFACDLPDEYVVAMTKLTRQPVWLNLEYLSAEGWVVDYHGLPSQHPRLPLTKFFFFPGFVSGSGGLLREKQMILDQNTFDVVEQCNFLQQLGVPPREPGWVLISLFCYNSAPLDALLSTWSQSTQPIYLLVPDGSIAALVANYFKHDTFDVGTVLKKKQLTVQFIPFLKQSEYDKLLWCCDFNFVRGEDSFVRAHWASLPFIWHIYSQKDAAHQAKLEAFLNLYTDKMEPNMANSVRAFWCDWNNHGQVNKTWPAFYAYHTALKEYTINWAKELQTLTDLASNLVWFVRNRI